jgi:hypothetical protein
MNQAVPSFLAVAALDADTREAKVKRIQGKNPPPTAARVPDQHPLRFLGCLLLAPRCRLCRFNVGRSMFSPFPPRP